MKKLIFSLVVVAFFGAGQCRAAENGEGDPFDSEVAFRLKQYMNHRQVTLEILAACPPAECVYVALGRSPAVYSAMLENIAPDSVVNLPLSLRGGKMEKGLAGLASKDRAELFEHVGRFLPDAKSLNGKRVLVLDFVNNGGSLIEGRRVVETFYKDKGMKVGVDTFGWGQKANVEYVEGVVAKEGARAFGHKSTNGELAYGADSDWTVQRYDEFAQYNSFKLGQSDSALLRQKPNSLYSDLKKTVGAYVKADPAMSKFHPPGAGAVQIAPMGAGGCEFKDILDRSWALLKDL